MKVGLYSPKMLSDLEIKYTDVFGVTVHVCDVLYTPNLSAQYKKYTFIGIYSLLIDNVWQRTCSFTG